MLCKTNMLQACFNQVLSSLLKNAGPVPALYSIEHRIDILLGYDMPKLSIFYKSV